MKVVAGHSSGASEWLRRAGQLRRQQLSRLAELGTLVTGISRLMHMLQCERGASNVWLCSRGELYALECRASRALADDSLKALNGILDTQTAMPCSAVCERIAFALARLEGLDALRDAVNKLHLPAPRAMEQYSAMLSHLLSIIPQLNDSIDDPHVAERFVALYSLMQGKELVGQERALGAIGFTQGEFDNDTRQKLVDRIDGQQACFEVFLSHSPDSAHEAFILNCQPDREIEQLRRVACTRQPASEKGETARRWFTIQTARLEHLRTLEESAIADLMIAVDDGLNGRRESAQADADDPVLRLPDKHLLPLVRQQAREIEQLSRQLASLRDALEERKIIDKAKSVLMTHQKMSEEQAWAALRKMAMDTNQRMVDVARALLSVKNLWPGASCSSLHK